MEVTMDFKAHREVILAFLRAPHDIQAEVLLGSDIVGLNVRTYKAGGHLRALKLASDEKARQDPIHEDFDVLMGKFDIEPSTGIVTRGGRKPLVMKNHYLVHHYKKRAYLCHRLVMMKVLGRFLQPNEEVDHINMDKADNRIANLRIVDPMQNKRNWQAIKKGKYYKAEN